MKKLLILLLFPLMMFAQDSTLIGDVDCSGEVNSQDASLILQFVTNVIDELPCEANMTGLTPDQLQEMIDMMDEQLNINYTSGLGGFHIEYPQGFFGEIITHDLIDSYIVPEGKNLYITNLMSTGYEIQFDGVRISMGESNNNTSRGHSPFIAESGQVISTSPSTNANNLAALNGFLVDNNLNIESITHDLIDSYIVPEGKNLYITNLMSTGYEIQFDGVRISMGESNNNSSRGHSPFIAESGKVISTSPSTSAINLATFNGYLVDEDYFSSVGSGSIGNENENEINQNIDGVIIGSTVDNSIPNGSRIYFAERTKIVETDVNGSFINIIYELGSTGNNYINGLHVDPVTQQIFWVEGRTDNFVSSIMKSSLVDFQPKLVINTSYTIAAISDIWVSPSSGLVFWSISADFGPAQIFNNSNNETSVFDSGNSITGFCMNPDNDELLYYGVANSGTDGLYDSNNNLVGSSFNGGEIRGVVCDNDTYHFIYNLYGWTIYSSGSEIIGEDTGFDNPYQNGNHSAKDMEIIPSDNSDILIWSTGSNRTINRINTDGDDYQIIYVGESDIHGIGFLDNSIDSSNNNNDNDNNPSTEKIYYAEVGKIIEMDYNTLSTNTIYETSSIGSVDIYSLFIDKDAQEIYWCEGGGSNASTIKKSSLLEFNPEVVINISFPVYQVTNLWVSPFSGLVYWSIDQSSAPAKIFNNLNNTQTEYFNSEYAITGFCIDPENDELLYYGVTNSSSDGLYDSNNNLVGSSFNGGNIRGLVCDFNNEIVYYIYNLYGWNIYSSNFGSSGSQLIGEDSGFSSPYENGNYNALDMKIINNNNNSVLIWTTGTGKSIRKINIDGSNYQILKIAPSSLYGLDYINFD